MAGKVRGRRPLGLLSSTIVIAAGISFPAPQAAVAQTASQTYQFDISAKPIRQALHDIVRASNLDVVFLETPSASAVGNPVHGTLTPQQAIAGLLNGTGLSYHFTGPNAVTIADSNASAQAEHSSADGSTRLDPIIVKIGNGASVYAPYQTGAPTAHIPAQTIERYRGANASDMFRGTPGVMSGDARNSGSAVDVNVRGMQGMGRVNVTIDGAMNSTTVYQGYQGISNRSFVDPDFVAGIDITKGSDAQSRGIAGTVSMRTLDASDIVKDGKSFGFRLKGDFGTNTSKPNAGDKAGYSIANPIGSTNDPTSGFGSAVPSQTGMDRPSLLTPTQGSRSFIAAFQKEEFDLLLGYAQRKRGNYHAGKHGSHADPVSTGPRPFCYSSGNCPSYLTYRDVVENRGLVNYRAGEEVLNTELETRSFLGKGTLRFGDGHSLQLGYMWTDTEAGDVLASRLATNETQAVQQAQTVGAQLKTFTLKHRWEPADSDLIKLSTNLWHTDLRFRNPRRAGTQWSQYQPGMFGLPADYRVGTNNVMWGGDISNTSAFDLPAGALSLTYGLSYLHEDTRPSPFSQLLEDWLVIRDGNRQEAAAFVKGQWETTDWLTVNAGLRYQHFSSKDRTGADTVGNFSPDDPRGQRLSGSGWSPSIGVTFEPLDGTQVYVNYSDAQRMPSLFETLTGYSTAFNPALKPERSRNWEVGTNFTHDSAFALGDKAMLKLGYFNWDVKNYLSREYTTLVHPEYGYSYETMRVYNIDRAKFEGIELSARYERGGFTADLAANYYLDVEFCKTAATCDSRSLYADYATNQIPPKYTVSLTASQKLLEDSLTLGGRVSRTGSRAIGHGEVTAQGASAFISQVEWKPYTLVDIFAEYEVNDYLTGSFRVENLTDQFYIDPLNIVTQPGPGRTVYASLTAEF